MRLVNDRAEVEASVTSYFAALPVLYCGNRAMAHCYFITNNFLTNWYTAMASKQTHFCIVCQGHYAPILVDYLL
jgi:hypothetical protein